MLTSSERGGSLTINALTINEHIERFFGHNNVKSFLVDVVTKKNSECQKKIPGFVFKDTI